MLILNINVLMYTHLTYKESNNYELLDFFQNDSIDQTNNLMTQLNDLFKSDRILKKLFRPRDEMSLNLSKKC